MAKFAILLVSCCFVALLFAGAAEAGTIPIHIYNTGEHVYYYYTADTQAPLYNPRVATTTVTANTVARDAEEKFEPYQKYLACVPRTFVFENCTLCFCTDVTSVALCWDYKGEKCAMTQKLVEQQKNATNNDPNGVW